MIQGRLGKHVLLKLGGGLVVGVGTNGPDTGFDLLMITLHFLRLAAREINLQLEIGRLCIELHAPQPSGDPAIALLRQQTGAD